MTIGNRPPTMMGAPAARLIMRVAMSSASWGSSLGASPMMPSTVTPVIPQPT